MSYAEFVEWRAFTEVEPLPQARADLHTAMQMMLQLSIHRQKRSQKIKLEKLIPDWWRDRRSPRALEAKFRALTAAMQANNDEEPEQGENGSGHHRIIGGQAGPGRR